MNLRALQHVITSATVLAEGKSILVLGSASLLASFPELGEPSGPLATTYDADILAEPFDELTAVMLHEALGENRAYYQIHGYHADILRDSILETLPRGWRGRLVEIPDTPMAFAISPSDLAAVKLLVGRPKDLNLLRVLSDQGMIDRKVVEPLLGEIDVPVEARPRLLANFRGVFGG